MEMDLNNPNLVSLTIELDIVIITVEQWQCQGLITINEGFLWMYSIAIKHMDMTLIFSDNGSLIN